jgi:hypothetical protein
MRGIWMRRNRLYVRIKGDLPTFLRDQEPGRSASHSDIVGSFSGRFPASTPMAATAVERRPILWYIECYFG